MEGGREINPFLQGSGITQFQDFTVVKIYPPVEKGRIDIAERLMTAGVIMIGETHGSRLEPISRLISYVAMHHNGSLALLVEGEVANEAYLDKNILEQKKDKIEVLSWDTAPVKKVLSELFSQAIDPGNLAFSQALETYLKSFSSGDLVDVGGIVANLHAKFEELNIFEAILACLDVEEVKFREEVTKLNGLFGHIVSCVKNFEHGNAELLLLKAIFAYYIHLNQLVNLMSIKSLPSRNAVMVHTILDKLATHEKVIVVAGRLHLSVNTSPEMKDNLDVRGGIEALEYLDNPFNEVEYILLEAPLPEDDSFPEPVPLPAGFLDDDDKELREKVPDEKSKASLDEPLKAKRFSLKNARKAIKKADLTSLGKVFAEIRDDLLRDLKEKGIITTSDSVAFAKIIAATLKRSIDLKEKEPPREGSCIAS